VEGSSEFGNEPLGFIRSWDILEWLRDWWLVKEDSVTWS
jgi:hypothetical protein